LERLKEANEILDKDNKQLRANEQSVNLLRQELTRQSKAQSEKEEELRIIESNLKIQALEFQLKCKEEINVNNKEFMLMLVKNPRAIEYINVHEHGTVPYQDQYGGIVYGCSNKNTNGTKEIIESKDN